MNKESFLLKLYNNRFSDSKDRISKEIDFLNLLADINIYNVPKILAFSKKHNWALFSWIEGNKIIKPMPNDWDEVIQFITRIQIAKESNLATKIGNAVYIPIGHKNNKT